MNGSRLTDYIENNKILINTQFGFRKNNSTEMATIKFVDCVNASFEAVLIPASLFLDLKKAFDTIDCKQLLLGLEKNRCDQEESTEKGIFLEVLKVAKIIPWHKGGKRDEPSNKRPISILPFFQKYMKR